MRVALIHDWLTGMRGGEKVLEVLCELFPDADLFTLFHLPGTISPTIEDRASRRLSCSTCRSPERYYRRYLPLFPWAIERFRLDGYDLVISSSHCVAKSVITPAGVPSPLLLPLADALRLGPVRRVFRSGAGWRGRQPLGISPDADPTGAMGCRTADRPSRFVSNSQYVAGRIARYYNRWSTIVYPPVDTVFYHPASASRASHFLVVSALVPYKRIDLAIDACQRVGVPLRIVGDGPDRRRLEAASGRSVTFLGRLTDEQIRSEYQSALAVLLPGEEDFGIVPVEAQACGTPVVALAAGGALETVVDGETGALFHEGTAAAMAAALQRVMAVPLDRDRMRERAERFSRERHVAGMRAVIDEVMAAPTGTKW